MPDPLGGRGLLWRPGTMKIRHYSVLTYRDAVWKRSRRGGCQLFQNQHAQRRYRPTPAQHRCHHRGRQQQQQQRQERVDEVISAGRRNVR